MKVKIQVSLMHPMWMVSSVLFHIFFHLHIQTIPPMHGRSSACGIFSETI